jgi:hypothetical protein
VAPSWVIGEKTQTIAKLVPDEKHMRYDIEIHEGVPTDELRKAKECATVKDYRLLPPHCGPSTPIEVISRNLRMWENDDIEPRSGETYQERLYCIRWVETFYEKKSNGKIITLTSTQVKVLPNYKKLLESGELKKKIRRYYRAPTQADLEREQKVRELLHERFVDWQRKGYLPSRRIEPGNDINRPTNARGWSYWHHFFNPRQLLTNGLFAQCIAERDLALTQRISALLGLGRLVDWNSRQSRWHPNAANEKGEQTFYKPSLVTPLFNYCCRSVSALDTTFLTEISIDTRCRTAALSLNDGRANATEADIWVTDPPYADAVHYHELSEFFLAWYEKHLSKLFPGWYTDSKRALAIKATDPQIFRQSMVECYRRLVEHMPDDGLQVVMFTHHDASVWADLTMILWAAGLRVSAAWCIATETDSTLKQGNYVQGTVLLVLRKQDSDETAFLDEIYPQVESEVKAQLDAMLALEDQEDPSFSDTDYQLAAYAAALRVLTQYKNIEDIDVAYELSKTRKKGEESPIEHIIADAVKVACDYLVPQGLDTFIWNTLLPDERFYLKGLDLESHGEYRAGAYQELARGFGVKEYQPFLSSGKANQTRLKTATEFGSKLLGNGSFGASLVRHALFAIREVVRSDDVQTGKSWLRAEVKNYWQQRRTLIEMLHYFATMGFKMNHWRNEAKAVQLLAGAVENDST